MSKEPNLKKNEASQQPLELWQRLRQMRWLRQQALWLQVSLKQPFSPRLLGTPMTRAEIGLAGEILAARRLRQVGRKVLYRNYRGVHRGEVDIVARHHQVLTFVEVKTRTSAAFGRPADAVNAEKQHLIRRGAQDWLRLLGHPRITFRFDIAEVLLIPGESPRLNVIENAFQMQDASLAGR